MKKRFGPDSLLRAQFELWQGLVAVLVVVLLFWHPWHRTHDYTNHACYIDQTTRKVHVVGKDTIDLPAHVNGGFMISNDECDVPPPPQP